MFEPMAEQVVTITLYTDAFVVRGTLATRQRRLSDILNQTDYDFIVLSDVVIDEFGSHSQAARSEFAQVIQRNGGQVESLLSILRERVAIKS